MLSTSLDHHLEIKPLQVAEWLYKHSTIPSDVLTMTKTADWA